MGVNSAKLMRLGIHKLLSGNVAGTASNDAAAAGSIGELISSLVPVGSTQSMTTNTALNVTSISLTPGDWDVQANLNFINTGATLTGAPNVQAGINTTSATLPTDGSECSTGILGVTLTNTDGITLPRKRISLAATTTVYLVAKATFTVGTFSAYGGISARRMR